MTRACAALFLAAVLFVAAFGQSPEPRPTFEVADVHSSPRSTSTTMRTISRSGRYEVVNATMLDLIRTAYSVDADKIMGGPNWLDFDRFDIIAKASSDIPADTLKSMLQSLLAERFKLAVHKDTQPMAGFVLVLGKGKPKLKEASGTGASGCRPPSTDFDIVETVSCHGMTMEAFAAALREAAPDYVTNAVVDSTGLKGAWDFDLEWTNKNLLPFFEPDGVNIFDAIDKQLGLKLEERKLPTPVLVVDQVTEKPTANSPDLTAKLPALPPAEFEAAVIKPGNPAASFESLVAGGAGVLRGGRINLPGRLFPLRRMIIIAWNLNGNEDIVAPNWIDSANFDLIAKTPREFLGPEGAPPSLLDLGPMLQALLIDRFKMKVHFENRPVNAYKLVAAKPKLKKADPATRTGWKVELANRNGLPSRVVKCQNMTMAQFADQLQIIAGQYVHYPVVNATGIEGAWDFTFTFSPLPPNQLAGLRDAPPESDSAEPAAAEPAGGISLFDAVEKQLGLKLEAEKRSHPVFVIDHIEEKPTDN